MNSDQIREAFLHFFETHGHTRVASSSLIPVGDPTLLLTSAGMVQFKPYFAGQVEPPNRRLATAQKTFRTSDIDEVGDASHLTLFEMMGNFSFGDYFKKEAIEFALEFVTKDLGLDMDRCSVTVHTDDKESRGFWRDVGVSDERIFEFGDDENWWGPAGTEGACGPDSEIHYDRGMSFGCGQPDCAPNCTNTIPNSDGQCGRFLEFWNLVFMQFYQDPDGNRTPLPATGVDTGMGMERVAALLQGTDTVFETDLFTPLIAIVERLIGRKYGEDRETDYGIRTLVDHGRSASFLIADGVVPGNEGRGYVLRRVLRRAIRHGRRLGLDDAFLGDIAGGVIEKMGGAYPELRNNDVFIKTVMKLEEERFQQAFQSGHAILMDALEGTTSLPGHVMFQLWDTFGFPVEMTEEIAAENDVTVDREGFEREMQAQRERGRAAAHFSGEQAKIRVYESLGVGATTFLGYEQLTAASVVVGLIAGDQVVSEAAEGQDAEVVLVQTPFYPEGGGQVGDAGQIAGPDGSLEVSDTQTVMPGVIVHFGKVKQGRIAVGDSVDAYIDLVRREDTARNHTATHLVHSALRQVLGLHVRQAGSLVAPDRLRFDFTHVQAMTDEEVREVQWLINERIRQNSRVVKSEDSYTSAIQRGALAFFGDKYEDNVRLVEIANGEIFSFEVCGGTHVSHTGELGAVYLLSEASIGSGIRRLEAVSGRAAELTVGERFGSLDSLARQLDTSQGQLSDRVQRLLDENAELRRERDALERRGSLQAAEVLLEAVQNVDGVTVLSTRVTASSADAVRDIGDWLRDKIGSGVVVLGSVVNDRPVLVAMVTKDLVATGLSAVDLAKGAAKAIGGGGGGRPDVAQAGGRLAEKLDEALSLVPELVRQSARPS